MAGAETAYIVTEQAQEDNKNKVATMEQEVIRMAAESADFKKQVVAEITKLKMEIEQGDSNGKDKEDFYKPITEYRAVLDLGELTNDKSGFRD